MCKDVAARSIEQLGKTPVHSCVVVHLKGILVHSRACAPYFEEQARAHMQCALQAPMQVETNLQDKACRQVMRTMCSRAAMSYACSAHKQKGVREGKQADWVIKQSTNSNDPMEGKMHT